MPQTQSNKQPCRLYFTQHHGPYMRQALILPHIRPSLTIPNISSASMVFRESPKRLSPKRQPRKAADGKITDLPDELLLGILDHLEPLDCLRFRATCRAFTPSGNTAITQRMRKLYVSPSRSSLLAAIEICAHPAFSASIVRLELHLREVSHR